MDSMFIFLPSLHQSPSQVAAGMGGESDMGFCGWGLPGVTSVYLYQRNTPKSEKKEFSLIAAYDEDSEGALWWT